MRGNKAKEFEIWAKAVRFAAAQEDGAPGKKEKMLEFKDELEAVQAARRSDER